jgi:radical SAM superfamily enzyme YgiQ (UPF0313 family)
MKILLVQAYLGRRETFPVYPLGLAYISTALYGKGHEVQIFDPNITTNSYDDLREHISSFNPDIIGISLRNIDNQYRIAPFYYYKHFQLTLDSIRKIVPHSKIAVGGAGFSMFAKQIMERNASIDFGIFQEGEESLPELLEHLDRPDSVRGIYLRSDGKVVFTGYRPLPDFKNLPMPKRDFIGITPYLDHIESLGIQTKRGCPLKCTYCNYPMLNGNRVRMRDAKSICDEIEYLIKQFGIRYFMFSDSVFNIPQSHAREICEEIIKRKLIIQWSAWVEIKHAPKDLLSLAIKAGCVSVVFSPDGVSQNALDGLQKELKEQDIQQSLRLFKTDEDLKRLNVTYSIFVNPPGETLKGLFKTIIFYIKSKLYLRRRGGSFLNWIRLEPETKAYQIAIEKGVIKNNVDLLPDNEKDLRKVFYSNPHLKHLDFFVLLVLKFFWLLRTLNLKLRFKQLKI